MAPKARVQKRLYYKIGEACKALGIQPYVLRYWETEFPALSPSKSRSGQRVYSEKELEVIRRIKQLLYDEGYTIAGAKKKLEGELAAGVLGEPTAGPGTLAAPGALAAAASAASAASSGSAGASPSPSLPVPSSRSGAAVLLLPPDDAPEAGSESGAGGGAARVGAASGMAPAGSGAPLRTVPLPLVAKLPGVAGELPSLPRGQATLPTISGPEPGEPGEPEAPHEEDEAAGLAAGAAHEDVAVGKVAPRGEAEPALAGPDKAPVVAEGMGWARVPPKLVPGARVGDPGADSRASSRGGADPESGESVDAEAASRGEAWEEMEPTLPLEAPASREVAPVGEADEPREAGDAASGHSVVRQSGEFSGSRGRGRGRAGAGEGSAPVVGALDTSATKQIETVRSGIERALEKARQILALLASGSPQ